MLLNVWPLVGQTFNKRYDLRENGRAQVSWNIERSGVGYYFLVQTSHEWDTIAPELYVSFNTIALTLIDEFGEKQFDKRLVIPGHATFPGWANCCDSLPGGGVVVGGSKQDTQQNLAVVLVAFDAEGDTIFTSDLGVPGQQWNGFQVKRTQDSGFVIVGQTDATGYLDGFAIKTDGQGNEVWRRTYGVGSPQTDGISSVIEIDGGSFVLGGSQHPGQTTRQLWVQRIDALGDVIWDTTWGPLLPGASAQLSELTDGNIILASNWSYPGWGSPRRFYLAKLDVNNGSIIWDRQYGQIAQFQILFAVKEVPGGDLIACGVSEQIGDLQGVLLRTTATGDSLWMHRFFYQDAVISQGIGQFYDVLPTPDGGFIATGPVYSQFHAPNPPGYSQDAWVVKVDTYGCIVPGCNPVGITEQATNLLDALRIWPNPVQSGGQVQVELDLPPSIATKDLELSVVSMDGKVVYRQAVSPLLGRGAGGEGNPFTLSLSHLSSGLYHLHITNGSTWLTGGKLVVE